jgi:hypothetical protein
MDDRIIRMEFRLMVFEKKLRALQGQKLSSLQGSQIDINLEF